VGSFEHSNSFSSSIKYGEYLDELNDYQLPKNDSIPWMLCLASTTTDDAVRLLAESPRTGAKTSLRLHKEPVRSSVRLRTAL
jgi:hypothetical protein